MLTHTQRQKRQVKHPGEQHVAERHEVWQSWRTWLSGQKEDLRAPYQAACHVGTNAGLYVSLIAEGRYDEALQVAAESTQKKEPAAI